MAHYGESAQGERRGSSIDAEEFFALQQDDTLPDGEQATLPGARIRKADGKFHAGDLILEHYKVLEKLGEDSMGSVYKCEDDFFGVKVALKALLPELCRNSSEMEKIKSDFQRVQFLRHDNIVCCKTLEWSRETGDFYLVMEYCQGVDLCRWLKCKRQEKNFSFEDVCRIVDQIAAALDYAHGQKVFHRNIEPGKIMIDSSGKVKLLDCGFTVQSSGSMAGGCRPGAYMAPELWMGQTPGAATDQYALGVVVYEMLAGVVPFYSPDITELRKAVLNDFPELISGLSSGPQRALQRALSKKAEDRFASCSAFAAALRGIPVSSHSHVVSVKMPVREKPGFTTADYYTLKADMEILEKKASKLGVKLSANEVYRKNDKSAGFAAQDKNFVLAAQFLVQAVEAGKAFLSAEERKISEKAECQRRNAGKTVHPHKLTAVVASLALPGNVKLEMVKIKAGSFIMGSPVDEYGRSDDEKLHYVTLTKDFYIGKYPVTQEQYKALLGKTPSRFEGALLPVEQVSWNDAKTFCSVLNELYSGKIPAGYHFDLPTEAQWEYACRAGTSSALNNGRNLTPDEAGCRNLDEVAWYRGNSNGTLRAAGQKRMNAWGLYDMHGSVWEWCRDWYGEYTGDAVDPNGPGTGTGRVSRGGSWGSGAQRCRSAYRIIGKPAYRSASIGFRLALVQN
ncbi:MAG: SUMF1/EgtB/PvdO family nonheme iron enzyme [Lentisphaeria bacterium]|nr:SUMF1/EgtB/PvdO family nonheme iron enzyme [Lentisphaeria bacterium]